MGKLPDGTDASNDVSAIARSELYSDEPGSPSYIPAIDRYAYQDEGGCGAFVMRVRTSPHRLECIGHSSLIETPLKPTALERGILADQELSTSDGAVDRYVGRSAP